MPASAGLITTANRFSGAQRQSNGATAVGYRNIGKRAGSRDSDVVAPIRINERSHDEAAL